MKFQNSDDDGSVAIAWFQLLLLLLLLLLPVMLEVFLCEIYAKSKTEQKSGASEWTAGRNGPYPQSSLRGFSELWWCMKPCVHSQIYNSMSLHNTVCVLWLKVSAFIADCICSGERAGGEREGERSISDWYGISRAELGRLKWRPVVFHMYIHSCRERERALLKDFFLFLIDRL